MLDIRNYAVVTLSLWGITGCLLTAAAPMPE